jgi:hypothetical protein
MHVAVPLDLKAVFGDRFRIALDESYQAQGKGREAEKVWCYRIECRFGHIYLHGRLSLGAGTDRRGIIAKLKRLAGCSVHQEGDRELIVVFDPADFEAVAAVMKPKRRRCQSEKQKAALAKTRDLRIEKLKQSARAKRGSKRLTSHDLITDDFQPRPTIIVGSLSDVAVL